MFSSVARLTVGSAAFLLCSSLAACGGDSTADERADTLPEAITSSAVSPQAETVVEETPLTAVKARKALLSVQDMPTGWSSDEVSDSGSSGTISPAKCAKMTGGAKNLTSLATAAFSGGGSLGPSLEQEIYRPKGESPSERLQSVRDVMADCGSYTAKDSSGTNTMKLSSLSFPDLGDGTLAVRGKLTTASGITATDDVLYIAVGDVILRIDSISIADGLSGEDLESIARAAVNKLEKAV
ncbi:hypothetical protein JCM9957A_23920 [Kineosporia succinea]